MITVGMDYEIFPEKEEIFLEKFKGVIELLNTMDLHHTTRLYKDAFSPRPSFLVISEWETREGFLGFIKSDVFKQTTDWGQEGILSARPRHKVYQTENLERPE